MNDVPYYLRGDDPEQAEVNAARLAIGLPLDRFVGMNGGVNTGMLIVCRCIHCGTLFASKSHDLADLDHICAGDCERPWMHKTGTLPPKEV